MQGIIGIKGKPYTLISERVRLAHETRESFEMISSGALQVGPMWVWQVVIEIENKRYIGTSEIKFDAPKNTADGTNPIACAETSAVGRALGMAGLGSVDAIASADEVLRAQAEQERPQPVERKPLEGHITKEQLNALTSMYHKLNKPLPNVSTWSAQDAADEINRLQAEWRKLNQKAS